METFQLYSASKSWADDIKARTRKWLPACGIIKVPFMEVRLEHLETIRKALKETISLVDCLSQSMKPLTIQQVFWITAKCVNHGQARTEKDNSVVGRYDILSSFTSARSVRENTLHFLCKEVSKFCHSSTLTGICSSDSIQQLIGFREPCTPL